MATASCGGPHVPMRSGRVDATAAGPSGVPEPETDLQTTLNDGSNAGFNGGDYITLTACGHSVGGVHRVTFPQVTTSSEGEGTDELVPFDETQAVFDVDTVTDYVQGTGDLGGPLVTTSNVTVQSDLRLYNSDKNATMKQLFQSQSYFESECASVFQRMIETVPNGKRLNPPMDPTSSTNLKPYGLSLTVDWDGSMTFSGNFRYVQVSGASAAPDSLTIGLVGRDGTADASTTTTATKSGADTGTGIWGPTNAYPFTLTFSASTGLSGLTANGVTFEFQDTMFVASGLSSVSPSPPTFAPSPSLGTVSDYTVNTTVAYLTTNPPASLTATFAVPKPQTGTVSPAIDTSTTTTLELIGSSGPFSIYSGSTSQSISAQQAYGTSVDVAVDGQAAGVVFFKPYWAVQ